MEKLNGNGPRRYHDWVIYRQNVTSSIAEGLLMNAPGAVNNDPRAAASELEAQVC